MSDYARRRADRIREKVPILEVLEHYDYGVRAGEEREQQFACDLHGDGTDNTFSARAYPATQSWYCWGCQERRDAISTVMEKEDLSFSMACRKLEKMYSLPMLQGVPEREETVVDDIKNIFSSPRSFEQSKKSTASLLQNLTVEKWLPMELALGLWEAYDRVCLAVAKETWSEEQGKKGLAKLKARIEKHLRP